MTENYSSWPRRRQAMPLHGMTIGNAFTPRLHWCNGKPRPAVTEVKVQDGWLTMTGIIKVSPGCTPMLPNFKMIPNTFDATICKKGTQEPDAGRTGCPHRGLEP